MLRLSKKVEYGLMAVQYMAKTNKMVSAKEISASVGLSFDFLSKALQVLMKAGIVESHQGINGGYKLSKASNQISISEIINALEERRTIVDCANPETEECKRSETCTIKEPLHNLQRKIDNFFENLTINDLMNTNSRKLKITTDKVKG